MSESTRKFGSIFSNFSYKFFKNFSCFRISGFHFSGILCKNKILATSLSCSVGSKIFWIFANFPSISNSTIASSPENFSREFFSIRIFSIVPKFGAKKIYFHFFCPSRIFCVRSMILRIATSAIRPDSDFFVIFASTISPCKKFFPNFPRTKNRSPRALKIVLEPSKRSSPTRFFGFFFFIILDQKINFLVRNICQNGIKRDFVMWNKR